jgi:type III secretion protein L
MPEVEPISRDDLPRGPGVRIVRAAQAGLWEDGHRFLAAAREASERMQREAHEDREASRALGYAEGRAAGAAEASRLVIETTAQVDRYLAGFERDLATLVIHVVRRVLGELDTGELVARAAASAIAELRRGKWLKIMVHPAAIERVRAMLSQPGGESAAAPMTIVGDPALPPTACILASEFSIVDASIDTQIAAVAQALGIPDPDARS